ncbi:LysE family transporter [Adlercreutzia shanghongiae]|uniref:LysE family transporter n=1 Tax=Adlercreutzia shanghongiae TaxID=3111773 RepID=A0ABU6J1F1_9ACTN|nr:LysE family transporter [Adlercreutzia sp. R22]MEC4295715.1 LysE family transporter [Adlercreutzia sp. R22]
METQVAGAFLIYCLVNAFTPGPGNILALSTAASHGWRRGMPLYLGIFCGYFAVQAICALTVFFLGSAVPDALGILKYAGAAYVVWLAVHIARSRPEDDESGGRPSFVQGFLLQFVNVKIYLFGITALVGFIVGHASDLPTLMATEMAIASIGTVATLAWIAFGVALQKAYLRHFRAANLVFAATLVLCAAEMLA